MAGLVKISVNQIENIGRFSALGFPEGWNEKPAVGDAGRSFTRAFCPDAESGIVIGLYYNGAFLDATAGGAFRHIINTTPRKIFDEETTDQDTFTVGLLSTAMGNAGQNQITMPASEFEWFFLERLESTKVAATGVLHFSGYYKDAENTPVTYSETYSFDGTPQTQQCEVHELFFTAPTIELFQQFHSLFEETVRTARIADL